MVVRGVPLKCEDVVNQLARESRPTITVARYPSVRRTRGNTTLRRSNWAKTKPTAHTSLQRPHAPTHVAIQREDISVNDPIRRTIAAPNSRHHLVWAPRTRKRFEVEMVHSTQATARCTGTGMVVELPYLIAPPDQATIASKLRTPPVQLVQSRFLVGPSSAIIGDRDLPNHTLAVLQSPSVKRRYRGGCVPEATATYDRGSQEQRAESRGKRGDRSAAWPGDPLHKNLFGSLTAR